ncbi:hypothetical protein ISN45_Aa04g021180 [Arabidopsis thaliana x Arabidopsis arenosa]|uniref:CCHC-type domain-containing protein n=1 Tax=Arabidopsis thaliana x Arabidopsis arenosa TaxID=1240361 RepID=A0A8T2A8Y8_9BRAS|nr:hypothetical protein ISN45_Aa04g021180 [Arabidopsis thaliana x Arabidopsis arenosa]
MGELTETSNAALAKVKDNGGSSSIKCPMLTSTNYTVWAMRMRILLRVNKVWEVIEESSNNEEKNDMATALLFQSIPESLILQVGKVNTAKKVWEAIKSKHLGAERVKEARLQTLMAEFDRLKMKETETIDDFASKLSEISSKSASLGETIEESKIVKKFLKSLPRKKYIQIVASLEQVLNLKETSFEEIVGRLKVYEERVNEEEEETQDDQGKLMYGAAESSSSQPNREYGGENRYRGRGGRFYNRGRGRGRYNGGGDTSKITCYRCDKIGHFASDCPDRLLKLQEAQEHDTKSTVEADELMMHEVVHLNEEKLLPNKYETNSGEADIWYLDNGASNHMTGDQRYFSSIDRTITGKVRFGDDSRIDIKGKGSIEFIDRNGELRKLVDVYYIPDLKSNIISLGQATESGCDVRMREDYLTLLDRDGKLLVKAKRSRNRLYKVIMEVESSKNLQLVVSSNSRLWHTRLGHIGVDTMKVMMQNEIVAGLSIHTAPVEMREKLAIPEAEWPRAITELCGLNHIEEAAVISTCNRMEIYVLALSQQRGVKEVIEWMSKTSGIFVLEIFQHRFLLYNKDATHHIFEVSAGLDSLVLGEDQILAQVKQVVKVGQRANVFGRNISGLFKHAITVGKRVRTETNIASGEVSVSSGDVDYIVSGPVVAMIWEGKNVVLMGRTIIGATNPANSVPRTNRGDFGKNVIHRVNSVESGRKMGKLVIKHWMAKGCTKLVMEEVVVAAEPPPTIPLVVEYEEEIEDDDDDDDLSLSSDSDIAETLDWLDGKDDDELISDRDYRNGRRSYDSDSESEGSESNLEEEDRRRRRKSSKKKKSRSRKKQSHCRKMRYSDSDESSDEDSKAEESEISASSSGEEDTKSKSKRRKKSSGSSSKRSKGKKTKSETESDGIEENDSKMQLEEMVKNTELELDEEELKKFKEMIELKKKSSAVDEDEEDVVGEELKDEQRSEERKKKEQKADILTKALGRIKFKEMRELIGVRDMERDDFKLKRENVGVSLKLT